MGNLSAAERLKLLRKTLKLNQTEFAKKLGVTFSAVSLMELGKTNLTDQNINLICLTFHIREEWLREGKGEMFIDNDPALIDILETFRRLSPFSQEVIITLAHTLLKKETRLVPPTDPATFTDT
jgi:transcriptional regulator with XRE-family HTH domain